MLHIWKILLIIGIEFKFLGCHEGYNISCYAHLQTIKTQVAEQRNATLKKLRSLLSYMTMNHFMIHAKLFFWFRSMVTKGGTSNTSDWKQLSSLYSNSR